MRYRKLSPDGDYVFGSGPAEFLVNSPSAIAQAIKTRLGLWTGEWYLNTAEGTPYQEQVLGFGTMTVYDQAIQSRILDTTGVLRIVNYSSSLDTVTRALTITCTVDTIYGAIGVTIGAQNPNPSTWGRLDVDFVLDQSELT